jgi:hypothetical protein
MVIQSEIWDFTSVHKFYICTQICVKTGEHVQLSLHWLNITKVFSMNLTSEGILH